MVDGRVLMLGEDRSEMATVVGLIEAILALLVQFFLFHHQPPSL
jgi:hypothetical protein